MALPALSRGTVEIVSETPTRLTLALQMETPGLVVLADLWDKGWRASLNGQPVPILRVSTMPFAEGPRAGFGAGTLEFRYHEPANSETWSAAGRFHGAVILLGWVAIAARQKRPPKGISGAETALFA